MGGRKGKKKTNPVSTPKKPSSKPSLILEDDDPHFLPSSLDREENSNSGIHDDQLVCYNEPLRKEHGGKRGGHSSTSMQVFTTPLRRIRDAVRDSNGELSCVCTGFHEEFCEICIDDASSFTGDERDIETRFEDVRATSAGAIITKRDLDNEAKVYSAIPFELHLKGAERKVEDDGGGVITTPNQTHKGLSFDNSAALGITSSALCTSKLMLGQSEKGSGCIQTPDYVTHALPEADNIVDLVMEDSCILNVGVEAEAPNILGSQNVSNPSGPKTHGLLEEAAKPAGIATAHKECNSQTPKPKHVFLIPPNIAEKGRAKWEHSIF